MSFLIRFERAINLNSLMKIFKIATFLSILGILTPYIYTVFSIFVLKTTIIYSHDPKNVFAFYELIHIIPFIGILAIVFNLFLIVYFVVNKIKLSILNILFYLGGILLNILLVYFDPGNYLSWFFD